MCLSRTDELHPWILRLQAGDESARGELLDVASQRLLRLTSKMLKDFPGVKRWEDTDDVFQNASMRMHTSMRGAVFSNVGDFLRFAAVLIRRELIDLSRHYQGPHGHGRNQARNFSKTDSLTSDRLNPGTDTHEPVMLSVWTEFHEAIERMDDEDRVMFDLLWYQELGQSEAATVLGVSERTVQRRWQGARLKLHRMLHSDP